MGSSGDGGTPPGNSVVSVVVNNPWLVLLVVGLLVAVATRGVTDGGPVIDPTSTGSTDAGP